MDSIDLGKALFGKVADTIKVNTSSSYTSPTNTTTISGVALADSDNGMVSCLVAGTTCDIPTTVVVKDGDTVIISNTAHNPVVTGVIAGGDRVQAEVDDAAAKAETAHTAAEAAEKAAGDATTAAEAAREAAGQATTAASAASAAAKEATDGLTEANQQIADTQADVEAVQADIEAQKSELDTVSSTMDATLASIGDLSSLDTTLVSKVEQSAAQITSTVTSVEQLQTDMNDAQADITAASNAAAAAQSKANEAATAAATAQTKANEATQAAADAQTAAITAAEAYTDDIAETLQGQIDGAIETWSGTVAPTASNAPAKDWKTADDKKKHIGDLYYDTKTGYAYRYGTDYTWALIKDTDVTKAIADAAAAQQAADNAQTTANTAKTNAATAQTAATNAATAASTAQAGVDDLKPRVSSAESSITQLSDSITAEVSAREGTDEQVATLTHTASGLTVSVKAAQDGVDTLNGYLKYDGEKLTLGAKDSPSEVQIDNDSMDVVVGSTTVATFGETTEIGYTVIPDDDSYEMHTSTINLGTFFKNSTQEKNTSLSITGTVYKDGDFVYDGASFATLKGESIDIVGSYGSMSIGVAKQSGVISGAIHPLEFNWNSEFGSPRFNNGGLPIESGGTGATTAADAVANLKSALVDTLYPVGAIYLSTVATSPATLFGGSWTQIKDTFLLAAGSTYAAGKKGGAATHTLTLDEMPSHSHNAHLQRGSSPWGLANNSAYAGNVAIADNNNGSYSVNTASVGSGQSHNNMPPYLTVYMWKRTA